MMSHAHLRDGLQYQSLQAQIFLPAALKMRMMLVMWQVNSHNPSEYLAVDNIIVKFKQYILKKRESFGIKMFKLCDSKGYIYDMNVYLGKDRQRAAQHLTATHNTVANLTRGVEGFGHKLYMDNFFSSPDLFDDWYRRKFSVVGQLGYIGMACPRTSNPRH